MTSPRFSIISTSNNADELLALWKSLSHTVFPHSWEWIIGTAADINSSSSWQRIMQLTADIPSINLISTTALKDPTLGASLNLAVEYSSGDYLIFPNGNFIGDIARLENLTLDGTVYIPKKIQTRFNQDRKTSASTKPQIWPKERFKKIQGFNTNLQGGIFLDLYYKGYLAGFPIDSIPPLAFNYPDIKASETEIKSEEIITHKLLYKLLIEEARRNNQPCLNLVQYHDPEIEGFETRSSSTCFSPYTEIEEKDKNKYKIIRAYDILNYVPQSCISTFMEHVHELLIPGGFLLISAPSANSGGAFADPRSVSYWTPLTLGYFCQVQDKNNPHTFSRSFQLNRVWETYPTEWHKKNNVLYVYADLVKLT